MFRVICLYFAICVNLLSCKAVQYSFPRSHVQHETAYLLRTQLWQKQVTSLILATAVSTYVHPTGQR